jgi:hypothetical protein
MEYILIDVSPSGLRTEGLGLHNACYIFLVSYNFKIFIFCLLSVRTCTLHFQANSEDQAEGLNAPKYRILDTDRPEQPNSAAFF